MIRQQIGDLLEIEQDGKYYYVVVLTGIVMFGGNILFAFHSRGDKRETESMRAGEGGFNICSDLLLPKREGGVKRMYRLNDGSPFWRTRLVKGAHEHRPGVKAKEWFIYRVAQLGGPHIARGSRLNPEFRSAMDDGCYSFDLVRDKILASYIPDQNEHI